MGISLRSLRLLSRAAILAIPLIAAIAPWSALHAAAQLAQVGPPTEYGPPAGPPPTFAVPPQLQSNRPLLGPNSRIGPAADVPNTNQPSAHENDDELYNENSSKTENGAPLNPFDARNRALEQSRPPAPRFAPGAPVVIPQPVNPNDALGRALELSRPTAPGATPVAPQTPDDLYLRDQLERLGKVAPGAQNPPPDLQGAAAGSSAAAAPPARAVRPPVALPVRRGGSGTPPAGERRLRPDEVVIEVSLATTPQAVAALEQRHALLHLDQFASQLQGTNQVLARIPDGRTVTAVVLALQADPAVMSAQPNYLFTLQQTGRAKDADEGALQYAAARLRLPQAHKLATGAGVLVAMIDSGVDAAHPELNGAIAEIFDTLDGSARPHAHGTAIAGLIGARSRLTGAAPAARILAVRAFDSKGDTAEGSTFTILKGLDWAAVKGAAVINLSFAGPTDSAIGRSLDGAYKNAITLIAAAGNAGPKSPPLYPAADPSVIAITATDVDDKVFAGSNRGAYIRVAAPGVDVLVAAPDGRYQVSSGTSFAAAEVSGIVALMIERSPDLRPDVVRTLLFATGTPLASEGRGAPVAIRLTDASRAISTNRILPVAIR
jgi:subtilisin family serine protease